MFTAGAVVTSGVQTGKVIDGTRQPVDSILEGSSPARPNSPIKAQIRTIRLKPGNFILNVEPLLLKAEFQTLEGVRGVLTAGLRSLDPEPK